MQTISNQNCILSFYRNFLTEFSTLFSFDERKNLRRIIKEYYSNKKIEEIPLGQTLHSKLSVVETLLKEMGLGRDRKSVV